MPMNLMEKLKNKIIKEILNTYQPNWSILIYDSMAAQIIQPLFSKTDLLSYNIMSINHIDEKRPEWDFPAIYFLSCNEKHSKIINSEFSAQKYSSFTVLSLETIQGLNPIIKSRKVLTKIEAKEQRLFTCNADDLVCLSNILDTKFTVSYLRSSDYCRDLADRTRALLNADNTAIDASAKIHNGSLLILDRTIDIFVPLMHFFTFRCIVNEIEFKDTSDTLFEELRYCHLADVSGILQHHINKLNRGLEQLDNKRVNVTQLGKMVFDAPKNMEMKDNITKYSNVLAECFKKCDYLKEIVEAEQRLSTGMDAKGKRVFIDLDYYFNFLGSTKFAKEDKLRLFFLLKAKGINFSGTEKEILKSFGFSTEQIEKKLDAKGMEPIVNMPHKYDISRYEPILSSLICKVNEGDSIFKTLGVPPVSVNSLRKSHMISSKKQSNRKIIAVYIKNGITYEEARVVYNLSEKLGIEIVLGGDKILSPMEFVKDLEKNQIL
jgi:syntaxin-binding protein 1